MIRLFETRSPKGNGHFKWFRGSDETTVFYRLYRRDHLKAWHCSPIVFSKSTPTEEIAATLKKKRRALRDKVDELDLAHKYGITA
jgi:hypothetical protein